MLPAKHRNHKELLSCDINSLRGHEQMTRFFFDLGYNSDEAGIVPHVNYDLAKPDLRPRVIEIRRIYIERGDDEYQVLLLKVRSVAVALIQTIAQKLRS
jgi:hypothetical protein